MEFAIEYLRVIKKRIFYFAKAAYYDFFYVTKRRQSKPLDTGNSRYLLLLFISFVAITSSTAKGQDINCTPGDVCRVTATSLPLRGLPRPYSHIWAEATNEGSKVVKENVRAFFPLYIFDRQGIETSDPSDPSGWYQVGTQLNNPIGWMRESDLLEWRQALVVTYTHPGSGTTSRSPVLFFDSKDSLETITNDPDRSNTVLDIYKGVRNGESPPEELVSIEPASYIDIDEQFYILPVLEWEEAYVYDDPTRFLKVSAAVPNERALKPGDQTFENPEFSKNLRHDGEVHDRASSQLNIDIVFVMDMTGSMQPFLDQTRDAMVDLVNEIQKNTENEKRIRFGLVGYRDDPERTSELEFAERNFTETLVDAESIVQLLETDAIAAIPTPDEWAEDVYAGVETAISSKWRNDTIRLIILVGDASAHRAQDRANSTGMDAAAMRELLTINDIYLYSVYLRNPKSPGDYEIGDRQFRMLGNNPGLSSHSFSSYDANDKSGYLRLVETIANDTLALVDNHNSLRKSEDANTSSAANDDPTLSQQEDASESSSHVRQMLEVALIDYLGDKSSPPRDITGWVLDRDLLDYSKSSLNVSVLLSRAELNNLLIALENVSTAIVHADLTQQQFFSALQAIVTQGIVSADSVDYTRATRLADTPLLPNWINSLPYRSEILDMSNEMFEDLTTTDRSDLQDRLSAKLEYYQILLESPDLWVSLDEHDESIDHVIPVRLVALP